MTSVDGHVPAWDMAVRVLHWTLAALVIFNLWRDDGDFVHRAAGYAAAIAVMARLAWAAFRHGGLAELRPSVASTRAYVRLLVRGRAPRCRGHDPLGVWMVWLLWLLVLLLALTGWMSRLDMFWGDERVKIVHKWLADVLLWAAVMHVAAVSAMSWIWRENLAASMVTGRKRADETATPPPHLHQGSER